MKVVHERNLEVLLLKLRLKEAFDSGNIKCKFGKEVITNENIYSLISESGAVNFVCDDPKCVEEFVIYQQEKIKTDNI